MSALDDARRTLRALLVLVAVLVGIIAGLVGGMLAVAGGAVLVTACSTAAVTFAGAVPLALLIEKSLGLL